MLPIANANSQDETGNRKAAEGYDFIRRTISALLACAFSAIAGCSPGGENAASEHVLRRPMEPVNSTDPIRSSSTYSSRVVQLLYETPLRVDYFAKPYRLEPGLCALPEVSPDGLTYTFRILPGSRFAPDPCFGENPDGSPRDREVASSDIAYSIKRLADPANVSGGEWTVKEVDLDKMETPDPHTLKLVLKRPLHHFPWLMALSYTAAVPREAVEKYGEDFGSHPVGSGPYRLEKWRRNHSMTFRRRPEWRGWKDGTAAARGPDGSPIPETEGAPFDRIEYLAVADATTQWLLFLKGEINMMTRISNDSWDAIIEPDGDISPELKAAGVTLHSLVAMEIAYVAFNMENPVVGKNRALRQALSCAFDFERWRKIQNDRISEANGPVPECVAEDRLDSSSPWRTDLEKAKRLMAEAGYPGGIDPATGRRLELTLAISSSQDARQNAEMLAAMFAEIGVKLVPDYMTWTSFLKSNAEKRNQLFYMGWVGDYPDVENFLMLFYGPNASPGPNRCNFASKEFDSAYEEALKATDSAARRDAWLRAQKILREECPWLNLGYPKTYALTRSDILGFRITDFPYGEEIHLRAKVSK